jgi:hypothetical protein
MIDTQEQQQRTDRLLQSIDLALKELMDEDDDPLALALYLWTIRSHKVPLVNSDSLARWGAAWVRRIFIDDNISRRRDEEVTSAALAAAALANTAALEDMENEIRLAVQRHISSELEQYAFPFHQPDYGAILLFAAHKLGADEPRSQNAAQAVLATYKSALPGGRMFGLGMAVETLKETGGSAALPDLSAHVLAALKDPRRDFEEQLYLISALWCCYDHDTLPKEIVEEAEQVVAGSPTWSYFMVGRETLLPAEEALEEVTISHLYRATLLDLVYRLRAISLSQRALRLDARYRGRKVVGFLAFCSLAFIFAGSWIGVIELLMPLVDAGKQYWLLGNHDPKLQISALLFAGGMLVSVFWAGFTFRAIKSLWILLVRKGVESDWRLGEILLQDARKVFRWWVIVLVISLFLGVVGNIFFSGLAPFFGGK